MQRYTQHTHHHHIYNWLHRLPKRTKKKWKKERNKIIVKTKMNIKRRFKILCGRTVECMKYDNEIWLCYPVTLTIKWTIECESEWEKKEAAVNLSLMLFYCIGNHWLQFEYHFGMRSKLYHGCGISIVGMDVNSFVLFVRLIIIEWAVRGNKGRKFVFLLLQNCLHVKLNWRWAATDGWWWAHSECGISKTKNRFSFHSDLFD